MKSGRVVKLKAINEQIKTNKQKLTDTHNSVVVTRGKGSQGVVKVKGGQIYGDGRRFDFGWQTHNVIYR